MFSDFSFDFLSFLLAIGLPLVLGLVSVVLILGPQRDNACLILALSYSLGMGILGQLMMLLDLLHLPLNEFQIQKAAWIYIACGYFLILLLKKANQPPAALLPIKEKSFSHILQKIITGVLLSYVLIQLTRIFWDAFYVPIIQADAYSVHAYKAKVFFYEKSLQKAKDLWPSVYPLQVSLNMMWVSLCQGQWKEGWIKLIEAGEGLAFVSIVYVFMKHWTNRIMALLSVAFILSSLFLTIHAAIAYGDFLVMSYTISSILLLCWAIEQKQLESMVLAGLMAAFACACKREGMVYEGVILVVAAKGMIHKGFPKPLIIKSFVCLLVPLIVVKLVFNIFKYQHHIAGLWPSGEYLVIPSDFLRSCWESLRIFLNNIFLSGNWNMLWFFLCGMSVITFKSPKRYPYLLLFFSLGLFLLSYFLMSLVIKDFSMTSTSMVYGLDPASRLLLHFFPLCPLLIVLMLHQVAQDRKDS